MPSTRPQDNVKIDPESPTEDEHALVNYTRMSGMHMFFFPKNRTYFDKYNCFDGISEKELDEWKNTYRNLLKQIEVFNKTEKKLLLKNPHSTARVKVLSEMYPKAKFIFIHRNPYDVFNSTVTLYEKAVRSQFLQDFSNEELNEHLLYCYEKMMAEYIRQRDCLSSDRIIEVAYDDLVENPMDELKAIYEQLDLGKFEAKTDSFQTYLDSLGTYKKNPPKVIDPELKQRIAERWEFAFQEWGYTS